METTAALRLELLTDRERTLTRIYQRAFPVVRHHVQQHGGTAQDAKDVFQDALVIFYEKAVQESFVLTASVGTYLLGVSRNLWHRELRRRARLPLTNLAPEHAERAADPEPADARATLVVRDYVEQLGERCRSVLLAFYYFQQPLEQIARAHYYQSVRSATVQKFKCLERLRQSVRAALAETLAS